MLATIVYSYVLLFFMAKTVDCLCSCEEPDSNFSAGVNLLYYKCNNETPATIAYPITKPEGILSVLDKNKRTIFYIFGYMQAPEKPNVELMMKALCFGRTDNIVLLDWSNYTTGLYPKVFSNGEKVARLLAICLNKLGDNGFNISNNIYIIGFSIGAHIAGHAAKCSKYEISRITGLDPANCIFYPTGCYLEKNDASFIDIIHTDMGGFGSLSLEQDTNIPTCLSPMGTLEIFVNGGHRIQPGCPLLESSLSTDPSSLFCSHSKAVVIYTRTKYYPTQTMANKKCSSYLAYLLDLCENVMVPFGYAAENITGSYYYKTGPL
ncbi:lipase member H-like [Pogonomyrmex barbatus]|uniref:phospholipase A1 n=1 Tax=Pogonomyrmex barbatus TaxID=144034 RepID=A0A6I9WYL6_9HYME|nr:lipase member H-like [Pogonomyrmex barbatus]